MRSALLLCACAQSPGPPFGSAKPGAGRVVLVRAGSAQGYAEGTLLGTRDDPLSTLGRVHAQKTAELLMDIEVGAPPSVPPLTTFQCARLGDIGNAGVWSVTVDSFLK